MNLHYGMHQIRTQKLLMTPELRMAIRLLQFSSLELAQYLRQQADENPLLEIRENENRDSAEADFQAMETLAEMNWQEYLRDHFRRREDHSPLNREAENPIERTSGEQPVTLEQHLSEQIRMVTGVKPLIRRIALFIAGNLNECGYLELSPQEMAQILSVSVPQAECALRLVQSLDPAGVGARNLQECLRIQLERAGETDALVFRVVDDHLEDLAYRRCQKVASALSASTGKIKEILEKIRSLDPKPGSRFYHDPPQYIMPDVKVEKIRGEYTVILNDRIVPRLSVNRYYEKLLRSEQQDSAAKQFICDKLNAAVWLIRGLEQRNNTLYRVTEAIMQKQKDFLDYGFSRLRPLTLKQISEMLNVHESTVSRVTATCL